MNLLAKLEQQVLRWTKGLPHLPAVAQKWIGDNSWWIVLVGAGISAISLLVAIGGLVSMITLFNSIGLGSYLGAFAAVSSWSIIVSVISILFSIAQVAIMALAIKALKDKQKKGWNLLFLGWLIGVTGMVLGAILSLDPLTMFFGLIFGAIIAAASGYLIFEINGQFARTERSEGVKKAS